MAKKVGIFLCDCNRSLSLDVGAITRSLNLPTARIPLQSYRPGFKVRETLEHPGQGEMR